MRRFSLRPTTWLAIVIALIGFASIGVASIWDRPDDWASNVAVEALALAATVFVVERIVRREAQARAKPRVDRMLWFVGANLQGIIETFAIDYAATHRHTYSPIPRKLEAALGHWLAGLGDEDVPRIPEWAELVLLNAKALAQELRGHRQNDADIMDAELVVAIDSFAHSVSLAELTVAMAKQPIPQTGWSPDDAERQAAQTAEARRGANQAVGEGVRRLLAAYRMQAGTDRFRELSDLTVRGAAAHRRTLMDKDEPI